MKSERNPINIDHRMENRNKKKKSKTSSCNEHQKNVTYRKNVTQNKINLMKNSGRVGGKYLSVTTQREGGDFSSNLIKWKMGKSTRLVSHKIFIKLTFLPKVVRTYAYKTISKLAESVCTRELDGA